MNILILDQHIDVTRSFLQRFNSIGCHTWVADHSLALVPEKYTPAKLVSYKYGFPYSIANRKQLSDGFFDAFVAITLDGYKRLAQIAHSRTKGIYGNAHFVDLAGFPKNILSFESRALKSLRQNQHGCLFVLSLPREEHPFHGPNLNGDYIQLIYDFRRYGQNGPCSIFDLAVKQYCGKQKISTFGDKIHATDTNEFPKMYCQLHLKNWGSGNDFAITKGMIRGIPPILYKPYITGSICDNFIDEDNAFLFSRPEELAPLLEFIDNSPDLVSNKGKAAHYRTLSYMTQSEHNNSLIQFFEKLI